MEEKWYLVHNSQPSQLFSREHQSVNQSDCDVWERVETRKTLERITMTTDSAAEEREESLKPDNLIGLALVIIINY